MKGVEICYHLIDGSFVSGGGDGGVYLGWANECGGGGHSCDEKIKMRRFGLLGLKEKALM